MASGKMLPIQSIELGPTDLLPEHHTLDNQALDSLAHAWLGAMSEHPVQLPATEAFVGACEQRQHVSIESRGNNA